MLRFIELERRPDIVGGFEIGLFYLPTNREFVTWLIKTNIPGGIEHQRFNGHYFNDFQDAVKDYKRRT